MENNDTINELYSHLEEINSTEITPDIFQKEIDNYKFYLKWLKKNANKDLKVYALCRISYLIHSIVFGEYNNCILSDLEYLKSEAIIEKSFIKKMNVILNDINSTSIGKYYEILLCIISIHNNRFDYFEYLTMVDDMKYKNIYYIPGHEIKSNKELIKAVNNSINLMR